MKREKTLMKVINEHYGADLAFVQEGRLRVHGESGAKKGLGSGIVDLPVIDYYPEYINKGYPWIDKWLEEFAEKNEAYWEWDNPAVVLFCRK
jgi:hypothetical protein